MNLHFIRDLDLTEEVLGMFAPRSFSTFDSYKKLQQSLLAFCHPLVKFVNVNVIKRQAIKEFIRKHVDSRIPLQTWFAVCKKAEWTDYHHLQQDFPEAFPVGDNRVVFDIKGNRYRIVARVLFVFKQVQIKWIGTHEEYNRIDVTTVNID